MPKLTNKKKLNEWLELLLGNFNAHLADFLMKKNLNFKNPWDPIEQIYKESKIFKLKDIVTISNLKFVYDQMNKLLPRVFEKKIINKNRHLYNTRGNSLNVRKLKQQLTVPTHSQYMQFVHGISFKTNSAPLHHSLT